MFKRTKRKILELLKDEDYIVWGDAETLLVTKQHLGHILDRLNEVLVSKDYLSELDYASRDDAADIAHDVAVDMEFPSKDDLKPFATKKELGSLATKKALNKIHDLLVDFDGVKDVVNDMLADKEIQRDLLDDKDFISDLAKAVEVARAMQVNQLRERKLEEFTSKELEMENSAEPWCDMMVIGTDDERGAAIRTGWNTAFIKYLKDNGFTGDDEEAIVQTWIGRLGIETLLEEYD